MNLEDVLREQFGLERFRPGQERVIRALLAGRDALGILPTGAGKSLMYQLTSQLLPGLTLVVSPLVALMHDQVQSLLARGIQASLITSLQSAADTEDALRIAKSLEARLLYVTPERLENADFLADLKQITVSMVAVDEAHSISEWGQNFRPAYLNVHAAVAAVGRPPVLALTATASPWVRSDIVERLGLRNPEVVVHGTERTNIFLEVRRVEDEAEDRRVLRELLCAPGGDDALPSGRGAANGTPDREGATSECAQSGGDMEHQLTEAMRGSGIIYVATTRAAQETVEWLSDWGIAADYYHGKRNKADRERVQRDFMSGSLRVVVATNAFGMGIDKPDIRFVVHRDIPPSLERYYQELGRSGRDGNFARCVLIYRPGDLGRAAFLAGGGELTREEVVRAHRGLMRLRGAAATIREIQDATGLGRADIMRLVELLLDAGVARRRQRRIAIVTEFDPEAIPLEREAARRAFERSRLEMMRGYAELRECRWRYILNYFGEDPEWNTCQRCDVDLRQTETPADAEPADQPFAVEDRVVHVSLGSGVVQRVTDSSVTVLFDDAGYKTLDTALVLEQELLAKSAGAP